MSDTRNTIAQGDVPGVEAGIHFHDHDAALGVAGHDRAIDRRGPAPARQQRRVQVEAAARHGIENVLRQDQPVGDDDGGVGAMGAKLGGGFRAAQ